MGSHHKKTAEAGFPGLAGILREYARKGAYPMHMPGHKRNAAFMDAELPYDMDITEIGGFDDLHNADGILAEGMRRAAELYGSRRAFYLVNGSTCGILAGIRACVRRGDTVLAARNCHMSVYHALELCGSKPVYIRPECNKEIGIAGSIAPENARDALDTHPETRLIVITSPTYEGVVSDIASIAGIAHEKNIPLLVDEAHGAHFGFSPAFPQGAIACGADIVIHSLHKTLPVLSQAALLHVCGNIADDREIARQLSIFETSSPSYPVMASIDSCISLLSAHGPELFAAYERKLTRFKESVSGLKRLRIAGGGINRFGGNPVFYTRDPGKIMIHAGDTGCTGTYILRTLGDKYGIRLEMAAETYALAMTSICDTDEGFNRLSAALIKMDATFGKPVTEYAPVFIHDVPQQALMMEEALQGAKEDIPLSGSAGRVSAEYMWCYPPGMPLLAPGERISAGLILKSGKLISRDIMPRSTSGGMPGTVRVLL